VIYGFVDEHLELGELVVVSDKPHLIEGVRAQLDLGQIIVAM
jgi:hypothetical protein